MINKTLIIAEAGVNHNGDLEKAKKHVNQWSLQQISRVTDSLTASDLKLRKYPSLFQRSILTQCLHQIMKM